MIRTRLLLVAVGLALLTTAAAAQPSASVTLTADDYRRAEGFLGYRTTPLVMNAGVRPTFLPDGRFWYRTQRPEGPEFVLVDPVRRTKAPAFDHGRVADALSKASEAQAEALLERARKGEALDALATEVGRTVATLPGVNRQAQLPPALLEEAFRLPAPEEGGVSVGMVRLGPDRHALVGVTKVTQGDLEGLDGVGVADPAQGFDGGDLEGRGIESGERDQGWRSVVAAR